jgi:hypothetical protein
MFRCLFAAALVVGAGIHLPFVCAADPPRPTDLKFVPADAALFARVDVEQVWNNRLGETFRRMNVQEIQNGLAFLKEYAGLTPDDLKSISAFVPQFKVEVTPAVAVIVTTKKPYDRNKLVAFLRTQADELNAQWNERPGHRYEVDELIFDLSDLKTFRFAFQYEPQEAAAADGPLTPAITAAANGAPLVVGVTFANLPDELRQNNPPAAMRPFQPLFFSEAAILTGTLDNANMVVTLGFRNTTRAQAVAAEKSLGVLKTLLETALALAAQDLERAPSRNDRKNPTEADASKRQLAFIHDMQALVKSAPITHADNTPSITLTAKADLDYAPLLEQLFSLISSVSTRSMASDHLKQLALAMHIYHDKYATLPPAARVGKGDKPLLSWRVMVLPYIDQGALYKKFKLDEPWDSEHNKKVLEENPMPEVFALPGVTKPNDKTTHYQVVVGGGAMFDLIQGTRFNQITDGLSNTIMIVTAKKAVPWTAPEDLTFDPKKDPRELLLFTDEVCNVAFGDGAVRALRQTIKEDVLKGLITRAGGEVIVDD